MNLSSTSSDIILGLAASMLDQLTEDNLTEGVIEKAKEFAQAMRDHPDIDIYDDAVVIMKSARIAAHASNKRLLKSLDLLATIALKKNHFDKMKTVIKATQSKKTLTKLEHLRKEINRLNK